MTASDFYDWARSCVRDLDLLRKREASLRTPRSGGAMVAGSGIGNPTESIALTAIRDEGSIQADIERCETVVHRAVEVTSQVGRACGQTAALALQLHYLEGNEWDPVATELRMSLSSLYRLRRQAFDWVDQRGLVANIGKVDSR